MKVILFADVTDPWSYVGSTRFERAAAMYSILTGEPIEIAYRAARPARDTPAEEVARAARISGIDLNVDDVVTADSTDAWRLLTWAAESGDATQRDLLHQLWRAHFLEGADLSDALTLASRAALVGLELETAEALLASPEYLDVVTTQQRTARELGADDLPYVVVDDRWTLSGLQSQDDYIQALHRIRADQDR